MRHIFYDTIDKISDQTKEDGFGIWKKAVDNLMPSVEVKQVIPTLVVGWERQMSARTNMNLQAYASKSVYKSSQTDLDELLSDKFQMSIGVRHRFDCCLATFAITENLQNLNNTPDIGFQMGFAWVPRIKPQR